MPPTVWGPDSWLLSEVFGYGHVPPTTPEYKVYRSGTMGYAAQLRLAFNFIRRHGEGRYSDATLMKLMRAADAEEARTAQANPVEMPTLVVADREFSYDEETEVKTGGVVGVAACWPGEGGKTALAVHQERRRQHIGTTLHRILGYEAGRMAYWVGSRNFNGQRFLLSLGLYPTAINSSGAVRYTDGYEEGDV